MYDRGRADGYKVCADELEAELAQQAQPEPMQEQIEALFKTPEHNYDMPWNGALRAVLALFRAPSEPMPYIDALTRAQAAAELYPHPAMEQRAPFIDGFLAALGFTMLAG
jgi:Zn-dependent protease with chaperone function